MPEDFSDRGRPPLSQSRTERSRGTWAFFGDGTCAPGFSECLDYQSDIFDSPADLEISQKVMDGGLEVLSSDEMAQASPVLREFIAEVVEIEKMMERARLSSRLPARR